MKKLFLLAIAFGLIPFLAFAQLFPFTVPTTVGGTPSVGTNVVFVQAWRQGVQYENTVTGHTSAYIDAVFVNSNTYVLDTSTPLCTSSATGAGPTGTGGGLIADGTCQWRFNVAGSNLIIPANYLATTKIETIAGGGGADNGGNTNACTDYVTPCGGGGGGGAYSVVSAPAALVPGSTHQFQVGVGGVGGAADGSPNTPHIGTDGTASWFNGSSCGGATVCSLPGLAATLLVPGAGGPATGGVGTQTAGGIGGKLFTCCTVGGGGGGAGGPKGTGLAGGNTDSVGPGSPVGAGGGGGGGGTAGGIPNPGAVVGLAGAGGTNWQSTGAGLGASCCSGGFSTSFPATEAVLSQSGKWVDGGSAGSSCGGPCWGNVQTNGIKASGVGTSDPTLFGDATAILTSSVATWTGSDQMATASVSIPGAQPSASAQEVELRLNVKITSGSIIGYEFNCSVDSTSSYTTLVRWNGANGDFVNLPTGNGPGITCIAGDQLIMANISGVIYAAVNRSGTIIAQFSSSDPAPTPWVGGSPGLGFYNNTGSANYTAFGLTSFQVPTPATNGVGGGGGGGATPRPGGAVAGNGSCGYEFDNSGGGNSLHGAGGGGGGGAGYDTNAAFPTGAFTGVSFKSLPGNGVCGGGGGEAGNGSDTTGGQVTGGKGGNGFIAFTYTHS